MRERRGYHRAGRAAQRGDEGRSRASLSSSGTVSTQSLTGSFATPTSPTTQRSICCRSGRTSRARATLLASRGGRTESSFVRATRRRRRTGAGRPTGSFPSTRQPKPTAPPRSRTAMNWSALRRLSVDHRAVVVLRHYLDLSDEAVADARVPVGTVRSRLLLRDARVARGARRRRAAGGPRRPTEVRTRRHAHRPVPLEAGSTGIPDRVLDAVVAELPSRPQRRSVGRREDVHDEGSHSIAAAAAVLVVAVDVARGSFPARRVSDPARSSEGRSHSPGFQSTSMRQATGRLCPEPPRAPSMGKHSRSRSSALGSSMMKHGCSRASSAQSAAAAQPAGSWATVIVRDGPTQKAGIYIQPRDGRRL